MIFEKTSCLAVAILPREYFSFPYRYSRRALAINPRPIHFSISLRTNRLLPLENRIGKQRTDSCALR
jgi:hypothetical protein